MAGGGKRRLLIASQPLDAGVPHHVLDLVRGLDRERFEIVVAAPRRSLLWRELAEDRGVTLHPISSHRRPAPLGDLRTLLQLVRLTRHADIVHGHSAKAGFIGRLAALLTGRRTRCIFTPHGWSFWAADGAAGHVYLALERAAAHWCRTIVALGESERQAGVESGVGRAEQYRIVPNGVDLARFGGKRRPVPGRIVMVGRLATSQKRPDLAIEAVRLLKDSHPHLELQLVGDGPDRAAIEALARDAGGAVRLLGMRTDIPELLAEAAIFLLASDYEGAPLSILEAMAAGAPVVASRVAGVPELVVDGVTGVLADPQDAGALATALDSLLRDPVRAAALGRAGRERARTHYSREAMIDGITAVYDEASGAGSA
jgi:glycosyltransferase involved in cell wall biosynthesis